MGLVEEQSTDADETRPDSGEDKTSVSLAFSFGDTSISRNAEESSSIFGDGACGEPLLAQHLVIDFTPVEALDNDFVQRKCCAFWDFISRRPEISHLMAIPNTDFFTSTSTSTEDKLPQKQKSATNSSEEPEKVTTAVSMLEFVEEKGLIDRTFEAKVMQSHCTLGSREYKEDERIVLPPPVDKEKIVCVCGEVCCKNRPPERNESEVQSSPKVLAMCKDLTSWDVKHPKSMKSPGHPPSLAHCQMQRIIP